MSEVTNAQIIERYVFGLKKAASRARELNSLAPNPFWLEIAKSLDKMRLDGIKLAKQKALTEVEIEMLLAIRREADIRNSQPH